jgi:hypothetical protein
MGHASVCGWEEVVVNGEILVRAVNAGAEIFGFLERHVAAVAVELRFGRVVKSAGIVAGDAAQEVGVIGILAPEEFLIFVEFMRDA